MNNSRALTALSLATLFCGGLNTLPLHADGGGTFFTPGNLVVSRSVYAGNASTVVAGVTLLPPLCNPAAVPTGAGPAACDTSATSGIPITAIDDGEFPNLTDAQNVWKNDSVDGSFGVTSPIFLDQITTGGMLINTLPVLPSQIVTSFSSKIRAVTEPLARW